MSEMENSQRWTIVIVAAFVAVGVGFGVWLGFFKDAHDYGKQLSQEDRAAQYVGAAERPKSKLVIKVTDDGCAHITRAEIDGTSLLMYAQNDCGYSIHYMEWRWQTVAPDGTYLKSGYENTAGCPVPVEPHAKAECHTRLAGYDESIDDRAASVHVGIYDAH